MVQFERMAELDPRNGAVGPQPTFQQSNLSLDLVHPAGYGEHAHQRAPLLDGLRMFGEVLPQDLNRLGVATLLTEQGRPLR
jgi:hypothetical protein